MVVKVTTNIAEFGKGLEEFGSKVVPEKLLSLQKLVALQFLKRVVELNPVGNPANWKPLPSGKPRKVPKGYVGGRSRANWQVAFGFPGTEVIDSTANIATALGAAEINSISVPFGIIWIFNNVPYIQRLEEGHSTQAPAGMVTIALTEIRAGLEAL